MHLVAGEAVSDDDNEFLTLLASLLARHPNSAAVLLDVFKSLDKLSICKLTRGSKID